MRCRDWSNVRDGQVLPRRPHLPSSGPTSGPIRNQIITHRAQPQLLNLRRISVKESPLAIHKQNFTGKREIKAAFCCVLRIKVVFAVLWRKVAAAPTAADYRLTTYLMSASVSAAANLQICLQLHLWTFIPLYLGHQQQQRWRVFSLRIIPCPLRRLGAATRRNLSKTNSLFSWPSIRNLLILGCGRAAPQIRGYAAT